MGARRLLIESDTDAAPFYRRMGARDVGVVASGSIPGRLLPRLAYELSDYCTKTTWVGGSWHFWIVRGAAGVVQPTFQFSGWQPTLLPSSPHHLRGGCGSHFRCSQSRAAQSMCAPPRVASAGRLNCACRRIE